MTDALILPVWPPESDVAFFGAACQFFNEWRALGYDNPGAIAMTTQAEFEAAFKSSARGDSDTAVNDYQDHMDRVLAILKATGTDLRTETSIHKIVAAAAWELDNTHTKARAAIKAATTAYDASAAACEYFEVAGAANAMARRGLGAERWAAWFAKNPDMLAKYPAEA